MAAEIRPEELYGRIDSVIYRSDDSGYAVIRLDTGEEDLVTAVGCIPCAAPGEQLHATGAWVNHVTHGRQFRTLPRASMTISVPDASRASARPRRH